jgi:hypothetical protein
MLTLTIFRLGLLCGRKSLNENATFRAVAVVAAVMTFRVSIAVSFGKLSGLSPEHLLGVSYCVPRKLPCVVNLRNIIAPRVGPRSSQLFPQCSARSATPPTRPSRLQSYGQLRGQRNEQRATSNEQRATSNEQRATSNEQRAWWKFCVRERHYYGAYLSYRYSNGLQ